MKCRSKTSLCGISSMLKFYNRIKPLLAACKPLILLDFHKSYNYTPTRKPAEIISFQRVSYVNYSIFSKSYSLFLAAQDLRCGFDKLEVAVVKVMLILRYYSSELRHSFFSLCVSIQNIERAK